MKPIASIEISKFQRTLKINTRLIGGIGHSRLYLHNVPLFFMTILFVGSKLKQ